ncbi:TSUP family transporter [Pelagerythrobacter marinus]|uniref:TSUP family transporter n=1 Tax=Pelagerythrobacter marinus TaxID=538382 RepID=UPI002036DE62|nr:TSUP family transporter [Pelagerythrobacter marinus]USA39277.1 TSUP family transporter [Pelagerythrobacter marinus]WPZ06635.1 TSUP family transporter [Pelagerythrobacter marinus]
MIADFTPFQIIVALAGGLGAAFVRGLAGFGMAILLVPVLALALMPIEAVLVTHTLSLLLGLSEFRRLRQHAERSAWIISGLVLLATLPGLAVLSVTPAPLARFLIALVALSAFAAILLPSRPAHLPGKATTGLTGLSSGFLTGFAGMPGPPVVPYYIGRAIPRATAKASMILIFTFASAAGLASGALLGELHWRQLGLGLLLLPVVLLGNWLGSLAFGRIGETAWRIFAAVVLAAAAIAALVKLL